MNYDLSKDALVNLNPQYIRMYLNGTGWKKTFKNDRFDVYVKNKTEQVIVPHINSFSDYPLRMKELLDVLCKLESRNVMDIYSDICLVNASDSIQYRISDGSLDGTITASLFNDIINAHRSIAASAYMDLIERNTYHKSCKKGFSALKDMRIGQTGFGSYIIRFVFPYGNPNQTELNGTSQYNDPVIKKVASRITESSKKVVEAAEDSVLINSNEQISYNFVDSLMDLEKGSQTKSIEMTRIDFISSKTIDQPITFTDKIFPRIADIVDNLKPKELQSERKFEGWISHADKDSQESDTHHFKLSYFDGDRTNIAYITLSGSDIDRAHESMTANKLVSLYGILKGYSSHKTIESIKEFHIIG